jgi:hypothetical protein
LAFLSRIVNNEDILKQGATMAKEEVKHRKDDKKKPALNPKEKKAKKAEKKQAKA